MKVQFHASIKTLCTQKGGWVETVLIKGTLRDLYIYNNGIDFYNPGQPPLGICIIFPTSEIQFRGF